MKKFNTLITLLQTDKKEYGRGCRRFNMFMDAETEEQAKEFVKQYLDGFVKSDIEIKVDIV